MEWRAVSTIRAEVMLGWGQVQVPDAAGERHQHIQGVKFERPRSVEGWKAQLASEYDVDVRFSATSSEEARMVGFQCVQELAASLSFLGSAPVQIVKASVTDAPEQPVPRREYTTTFYPEYFKPGVPQTHVGGTNAAFLIRPKPERVVRALRWIQKSHFVDSPVDEFAYLMIAFESVSDLLKGAGLQYWHCGRCDRDVLMCSLCGASTASKMTGAAAMREFAAARMGWSNAEWTAVWQWRNKILHGEADISMDEEHAVREYLPRLEEAVLCAVKTVAGLPDDHAPVQGRHRLPFSDPQLVVKWQV